MVNKPAEFLFSASEKLTIAQLLLTEVKVDRIEIASARVSEGEFEAVKKITKWAKANGYLDRVEVLTFVDGDVSVEWMLKSGAKVMNLLTKGSLNHLTHQLKKKPEEHFAEVAAVIALARKKNLECNVYLEDWSKGMRDSKDYVFQYLDFLTTQPVKRIMLPDTLGVLVPSEVYEFVSTIVKRYPNTISIFMLIMIMIWVRPMSWKAVKAGAHGLHLTINGMGERAGNAPLASAIAVLNDFMPQIKTSVVEKSLYSVSKLVETFSGFRIPDNKPVVGENVFTQTAGYMPMGIRRTNFISVT
jgi:D-citramalate synthase